LRPLRELKKTNEESNRNPQSKIYNPMFDMMKMMGKMKEVQARMKESQDKLGTLYATGESGAGLVKPK